MLSLTGEKPAAEPETEAVELSVPRRAIIRRRRVDVDYVIRFHKNLPTTKKRPIGRTLAPEEYTLTNTPQGLGDSIVLTDHERSCFKAGRRGTAWLCSEHFRDLKRLNPYHRGVQLPFWVSLSAMIGEHNLGNGHCIQRAQRLFGLPIDPHPAGCVIVKDAKKPRRTRATVHLTPGPHADNQTHYHPNPRKLSDGQLDILRLFIKAHPEIDFVEIGGQVLKDTIPSFRGNLTETIRLLAGATYHFGPISGPYHLARALGVRLVTWINFPHVWELCPPSLSVTDIVESEWVYVSPILHTEEDSLHIPQFSAKSLEEAMAGEIYPYGKAESLEGLIND